MDRHYTEREGRELSLDESDVIRLLLLDEHALMRAGVRTILENEVDIRVVAEASSPQEALRMCRRHRPDVVLVDEDTPSVGLAETVHQLRRASGDAAIVVLSRHDTDAELFSAVLAGASGHVTGIAEPAELVGTIRRAAAGVEPIGQSIRRRPTVGRRVLETFQQLVARDAEETPRMPLDERELEVLRLAADGLTNQQIGHRLGLSGNTVKAIVSGILDRLGVRYRTQAVVRAVREGWISLPETGG